MTRSKLSIGIDGIVGDEPLGVGARASNDGSLFFLFGQFLAGQHRIDALDGRDDDLLHPCRGPPAPSFWTL